MIRLTTAGLVLFCLATACAAEDTSVEISARFRETFALELNHARAQRLDVEILPKVEANLPAGFELTAVARARADALDRIEPGRPDQSTYSPASERLLIGENAELELRELYVERALGRGFLTLGKQQVVWGRADGIKLLDVVNPQSFREFILPSFDDSRIPLWTANVEAPAGPLSAQLLWVVDTTVHDVPERGAAYEITSTTLVPAPVPGVPVVVERSRRPQNAFEDGDGGLRLSGALRGWDLTLNYLYHYDDAPILRRSLRVEDETLTAVITPNYARTHVAGLTFANSFGDFTVRGEAAAFTNRYVSTNDLFDADGLVHDREYSYLFGLDWFGLGSATFLSAQIHQSVMPGLPASAVRNELQTVLTFLVRHEFADGAGLVQAMWLTDPDRGDGLLRGRVRYDVFRHLAVSLGADVFYGARGGIFGEFDTRDRIVFELEQSI